MNSYTPKPQWVSLSKPSSRSPSCWPYVNFPNAYTLNLSAAWILTMRYRCSALPVQDCRRSERCRTVESVEDIPSINGIAYAFPQTPSIDDGRTNSLLAKYETLIFWTLYDSWSGWRKPKRDIGWPLTVMDRDRRLTGFLRGQTGSAIAPPGFELNNPWRVSVILWVLNSEINANSVCSWRRSFVKLPTRRQYL